MKVFVVAGHGLPVYTVVPAVADHHKSRQSPFYPKQGPEREYLLRFEQLSEPSCNIVLRLGCLSDQKRFHQRAASFRLLVSKAGHRYELIEYGPLIGRVYGGGRQHHQAYHVSVVALFQTQHRVANEFWSSLPGGLTLYHPYWMAVSAY